MFSEEIYLEKFLKERFDIDAKTPGIRLIDVMRFFEVSVDQSKAKQNATTKGEECIYVKGIGESSYTDAQNTAFEGVRSVSKDEAQKIVFTKLENGRVCAKMGLINQRNYGDYEFSFEDPVVIIESDGNVSLIQTNLLEGEKYAGIIKTTSAGSQYYNSNSCSHGDLDKETDILIMPEYITPDNEQTAETFGVLNTINMLASQVKTVQR